MPRISQERAARHRAKIIDASAFLLKKHGLRRVSIGDLMGAVGLTHGGFYSHFETKDALILATVAHAYGQTAQRWLGCATRKSADEARAELLKGYLSQESVQNVEGGCPSAAFVGDVVREPMYSAVRLEFADGVARLIEILSSIEPGQTAQASRSKALIDYATIVGAKVLARAMGEATLSDEFLSAVREHVVPKVSRTDTELPATEKP